MILVIGSHFQGKKTYVKEKFSLSDSDFSTDIFSDADVIYDIQDYKKEIGPKEITQLLNKKAVISLEQGCEVLACDEDKRHRTEKFNEALQVLASKADSVIRLYCGIPVAIKGKI